MLPPPLPDLEREMRRSDTFFRAVKSCPAATNLHRMKEQNVNRTYRLYCCMLPGNINEQDPYSSGKLRELNHGRKVGRNCRHAAKAKRRGREFQEDRSKKTTIKQNLTA